MTGSSKKLPGCAAETGTMSIIGRKTLWDGRFIRTVLISYMDSDDSPGGSEGSGLVRVWEGIERVNCSGIVAVVPFTGSGSVIMIRQFRPPINGYVIELPAGLCDVGESFEAAAARELVEETGFAAGTLTYLTKGPLSSGLSSEILNVFVATDLTFVGIGNRDETEKIEVLEIPLHEIDSELARFEHEGNFVDLKVYGLVAMAQKLL